MKDTRANVSGNGEADGDEFFKVVLYLHDESQGDTLVFNQEKLSRQGKWCLTPRI